MQKLQNDERALRDRIQGMEGHVEMVQNDRAEYERQLQGG